jgi:hypothetical protein
MSLASLKMMIWAPIAAVLVCLASSSPIGNDIPPLSPAEGGDYAVIYEEDYQQPSSGGLRNNNNNGYLYYQQQSQNNAAPSSTLSASSLGDGYYIDPFAGLHASGRFGKRETQYLSDLTRRLRHMFVEYNKRRNAFQFGLGKRSGAGPRPSAFK